MASHAHICTYMRIYAHVYAHICAWGDCANMRIYVPFIAQICALDAHGHAHHMRIICALGQCAYLCIFAQICAFICAYLRLFFRAQICASSFPGCTVETATSWSAWRQPALLGRQPCACRLSTEYSGCVYMYFACTLHVRYLASHVRRERLTQNFCPIRTIVSDLRVPNRTCRG